MIWGIVSYYNAASYVTRHANFRKFADGVRSQGLKLMALEVAFQDDAFSLEETLVDKIVRFRANSVLWHKEGLFRLALEYLPDDCDIVCWLDGDIIFENRDWVAETQQALMDYKVVQPFSHCIWLPPHLDTMSVQNTRYPENCREGGRLHSFGFGWRNFGPYALEASILHGHVGFAWAARRKAMETVGFYDKAIVGSGDMLMAHAFVGCDNLLERWDTVYPPAMIDDYKRWAESAYSVVEGNVGYVEGNVFHLWHGTSLNRKYLTRLHQLTRHGFDPAVDLRVGSQGLLEWSCRKTELIQFVHDYFFHRDEDTVPDGMEKFFFGEGFYDDEGGFRWCRSEGTLYVASKLANWEFHIANNSLHNFKREQKVRITRNNAPTAEIVLIDNESRCLEMHDLEPGETLRFDSDFHFCPSMFGSDDRRLLSFMLLETKP